ncbi:MAG: glycosyltransferase family 39 protein [Acidobacteriota bacterium]
MFALSWILPLALYVSLAVRLITAGVGYEYDEGLYVESAVYALHGSDAPPERYDHASWIASHGRRWPLMIIPYVGTVKAWVAAPLFAIFGVSAAVARFAGVFLGGLGIAGLVALVGSEIGPMAGLTVGVALAIHPSYLDFTVFDNGGVSVWMGAMGIGALALANHLRRRSRGSALLLGMAAGLGVWARANVVWLIASTIVAALLVYGRSAILKREHLKALALGGVLGALPLLAYEAGSRLATLRFLAEERHPLSAYRLARRLRELAEMMISDGEQRGIWAGPPLRPWEIGVGAALLGLTLLCVFIPSVGASPTLARWRRVFAATTAALTLIMLTSGLEVSQHHLVAALPLVIATLVVLAVELRRSDRRAIVPLVGAGAGLAMLWLGWDVRADAGFRRTGGRGVFSSGLEEIGTYLASHPVAPERLKILNWGFQKNLYVSSGGSVHGSEIFWSATRESSSRGMTWEREIREGGFFLKFLSSGAPSPLTAASEGFSQALRSYTGPRRQVIFHDRSGSPMAALIEIPGEH